MTQKNALETFLRNSKSNQTRSHITRCYCQLEGKKKQKKNGGDNIFGNNFLSMLLNNPCHTDLCSTLSYHTERKDKSNNNTSTNRLNRGFFQKPTPA